MTQAMPRPKRVLLVDDNPRNIKLLELRLAPLACTLVVARTGAAAIAEFDEQIPDLVLLDFVLPDIDGITVLSRMRSSARAYVPIILISAHSDRSHRLRGLEAGADEFLEKPFDPPILLARLRSLLSLKDIRDGLQQSSDSLAARNRDLERLQREQRELTQFIVHDLKNVLSVVLGNLTWAQQNAQEGIRSNLVAAIEEGAVGAMRMRTMVQDLLDISNLEDSTFRLRRELVQICDILRAVLAAYQRKASEKRVELISSGCVNCTLWGDPALLQRAFENILDNSLRYAPCAGHVRVEARVTEQIEIRISNDGRPVPADERERIFEKFVRGIADPAVVGSAGLGLYFCKRVIEAHGGRIRVLQTPDWPTSFVIDLPPSASAESLSSELAANP